MAGNFLKKSFTALKASVKDIICHNNSILFPKPFQHKSSKIQDHLFLEKTFHIKDRSHDKISFQTQDSLRQKPFHEHLLNLRQKPLRPQEHAVNQNPLQSQEPLHQPTEPIQKPFNFHEHSYSQKPYKIQEFQLGPKPYKIDEHPLGQNIFKNQEHPISGRPSQIEEHQPYFYKSIYEIQKKLFNQVPSPTLVQSRSLFNFFKHRPHEDKGKRRVPKLLLLQNPFKWLMLKIDFSVLKTVWDPAFELDEFKFGTKQAISRVTQVISQTDYGALNGLLTRPARLSLLRELDKNWNPRQRSLLALDRDDIQISAPRKVYFIRIADRKYCDVDMAFLALKWVNINAMDTLVFAEVFARFHREYTPHCIPDWTIAYFKVIRFQILRSRNSLY